MTDNLETRATVALRRYNLSDRDIYSIDGIECRLIGSDRTQHVFKQRSGSAEIKPFSHVEFAEAIAEGSIVIHRRKTLSKSACKGRTNGRLLRDLPEKEQERVLFYKGLCQYFAAKQVEAEQGFINEKVNLGKSCLEKLLPEAKSYLQKEYNSSIRGGQSLRFDLAIPSTRHFARIYKSFQENGGNAQAFAPKYRGSSTRARRTNPDELHIRNQYVLGYASPTRPTMAHQYEDYKAHIKVENGNRYKKGLSELRVVCRKTFEKDIDGLNKFHVTAQREGEKAALAKYQASGVGFEYIYPLERVEMDEWKMDLVVVLTDLGVWQTLTREEKAAIKRARLWATVAIDVATRCVLAIKMHDREPCADMPVETLELALSDKSAITEFIGAGCSWPFHGMIETIATDNGAGLKSLEFEIRAQDLGIELVRPAAGNARARPYIERSFKTFSQKFLNEYSGRTFSNVLEKGDSDPKAEATMLADVFVHEILRKAIDIYHNAPHENLCGEAPRHAWFRMCRDHFPEGAPDRDEMRTCLGIDQKRTVGTEGVRFLGLQYNSQALQMALFGEKVLVRIDRLDISKVSVWNGRNHEWLHLEATIAPPPDLSIYEWVMATAHHEAELGRNTKIAMDDAVDTVNNFREGSEGRKIAELRAGINPLHNRGSDREWLEDLEKKRFASLTVVMGGKSPTPLVDLTISQKQRETPHDRPVFWDQEPPQPEPDRYKYAEDKDDDAAETTNTQETDNKPDGFGHDDDTSDISF